ncbi:hypothetical protein DPMN_070410 [Dreissena polymorpha]|uniref:Uncharacterized protein n=1 Tax=Dreissena polymorpha TaxID=45954 RepID=A0A9D4BVM1_DREPO|nr:hypothetical protein DPMN_070410 [Dreissena polymorpha]
MLGSENESIINTWWSGISLASCVSRAGAGEDADMHTAVIETLSLVVDRPMTTSLLRLPLKECGW